MSEPDWSSWTPAEKASLCFLLSEGRILLIHKKRGLGAGKINGPGGRLEAGESAAEAARRETLEEVGLSPSQVFAAGELHFQFADGHSLHCAVFTAREASGELRESEEAAPFWCRVEDIPFDRMWEDDRLWIPWMLEGRAFRAYFTFDGDRMLTHRIEPA